MIATLQHRRTVGLDLVRLPVIGLTLMAAELPFLWLHIRTTGIHRITDFIEIGVRSAGPLRALATSPVGYDGQFYYFMARYPGQVHLIDSPAYRYGRVLYPALSWLLAGGQSAAIPYAMLAVNIVAVALAALLLGRLLADRRQPAWMAGIAVLYAGQLMPVFRDLTDALALTFTLGALLAAQRKRWIVAALLTAAAGLTRETALVLALGLGIALWRNDRRELTRYLALSLAPFFAWRLVLFIWLGPGNAGLAGGFVVPTGTQLAPFLLFILMPMVTGVVFALRGLRGDSVTIAASAVVICSALLFIPNEPTDVWATFRRAAPCVVLLPLILPRGLARHWGYVVLATAMLSQPLS